MGEKARQQGGVKISVGGGVQWLGERWRPISGRDWLWKMSVAYSKVEKK